MINELSVYKHDFAEQCAQFASKGFRLMTLFAEEPFRDSPGTVSAVLRKGDDVTRVYAEHDGYASDISDIFPYAAPYQRLMSEMSGISFYNQCEPIIYHRKGSGHPLQKAPYNRSSEVRVPLSHNKTNGDGIFEIPVGPVHAGIIEPGHFRFSVAGEPVIELNPSLGYTHRGIEKLLETDVSQDNSRLVERISGDTCIANCMAYSEMMETNTHVPRRALLIRTLLAEMERLYNHVGSVSGICTDTAFTVPSSIGGGIQEKIFRMNVKLSKHRQLMNSVVPGGVRRDISDDRLKELDNFLFRLKLEVQDLEDMMMDNPALLDRMESTGRLTSDDAIRIDASGPIGRASGIANDVRKDCPYECYGEMGINTIVDSRGDVCARTAVRFGEITESISIVHQCIEAMEPGETRVNAIPEDGFHCSVVEAPRGELVHCCTVKDGTIWRYNVRDPSFMNWFGMGYAVPGNVVPDFPLINKSFGLSYSGNDL